MVKKLLWALWGAVLTVAGFISDPLAAWQLWRESRGGARLRGDGR